MRLDAGAHLPGRPNGDDPKGHGNRLSNKAAQRTDQCGPEQKQHNDDIGQSVTYPSDARARAVREKHILPEPWRSRCETSRQREITIRGPLRWKHAPAT